MKVVFFCGAGHSGSTLLGFILGSHSLCFYAGEAKKSLFIGDETQPIKKRVCKVCGTDCRIWPQWEQAQASCNLYVWLSQQTGKSVIVDTSKSVGWVRKHSEALQKLGHEVHLIFLKRDPRAVVNSRKRKYPEISLHDHVDAWVQTMDQAEILFEGWSSSKSVLEYETFCSAPEMETRRLCHDIGLEFEPLMLHYNLHAHHPLGGNEGTQSFVRGDISTPKHAYYEGHDGSIKSDDSWKTTLTEAEQLMIGSRIQARLKTSSME